MPWDKSFDIDGALDKAMHLFWTRGYEATSVQDLVDATGVGRGSLYATYSDKHSLFLASLRMYDESMRRKRLEGLEARFGPREAIRQLFLAFTSTASCGSDARGCFLTNTAIELAARDIEAARIVAHSQREIEGFFSRMIRKGRRAGEIGSHVRTAEAASGLLASLIGVAVLARSRPEPALLGAIVADALKRLT